MNDEKLHAALRAGDERAINEVIDQYSRLLWRVAWSVLDRIGSTQDVEECVADAFVYLWEHPDKYDPRRGKLKTWLTVVARSRALDRCREILRALRQVLFRQFPPEQGTLGDGGRRNIHRKHRTG